MSTIRSGWGAIGRLWGILSLLIPLAIALVGLLLGLIAVLLWWTGAAPALVAVIEAVMLVLLVLVISLAGIGTVTLAYLFAGDMAVNFAENWWSSGFGAAWAGLKGDVSTWGSAFVNGARKALAPLQGLAGRAQAVVTQGWGAAKKFFGL